MKQENLKKFIDYGNPLYSDSGTRGRFCCPLSYIKIGENYSDSRVLGGCMRKYLGSKTTAFAAIVSPLFVCGPLLLGVFALCAEVSGATVFLMVGGIACTLIWGLCLKSIGNQLYSWGYFTSEGVQIKTCFSKSTMGDKGTVLLSPSSIQRLIIF